MKQISAVNKVVERVPTLALRGITIFPGALFHFDVGRQKSIKAMEYAMANGQRIFLVTQRDTAVDEPGEKDLYSLGTYCKIRQILKIPNDNIRVLVEGRHRALLRGLTETEPFLISDIELLPEIVTTRSTKRDQAMIRNAQELFMDYVTLVPQIAGDVVLQVMGGRDLDSLSDYIAQNVQLRFDQKQLLLETQDPRRRMGLLLRLLAEEIEILRLEQDIQEKVKEQMDKGQRDYYLREQIKVLSDELGEGDDTAAETQEYLRRIEAKVLPDEVREKLLREVRRMGKMQSSSPESSVSRSYLDVCLDLPWTETKKENDDIRKARAVLEEDHYGLEKVKERILEFFAVKNLTGGVKGQILCLVGPPGVGKTSVARSIARCMGRDYARLSLGGVRDEAEIRGHRKTYIGAMPGRIINALRQAGSRNCLILIDEIDKLGSDYKGDPSSALLEVFDTEQNTAFRDHFVELPFDLSDVLFLTTANDKNSIPEPLLDRMEIIDLPGYTDVEKVQIARKHLIPKQLKKHGLKTQNFKIDDDALTLLIECYTKEAGVRTMERQIAKLCRKTAKYMSETGKRSLRFTKENLPQYLGVPDYLPDQPLEEPECGVVNGLAWTAYGGAMLEVEVQVVDGTGKLELTGNLGNVMKEASQAAVTYLRSRAGALELPEDFHSKKDIHIHFPEGAVPKDGPSAGITTATAVYSALTGRPVPKNVAMTGEITLRGRVLPIGGLREKAMAAYRNKVTTILIPAENQKDLEDVDPLVKENVSFVLVKHMDQVLDTVFDLNAAQAAQTRVPAKPAVVPPVPPLAPAQQIRQ
ncbi:MAG: endopeptidase La [Clostridia bacterium]|nr:endopeptidase La [Clostridia bacterium]